MPENICTLPRRIAKIENQRQHHDPEWTFEENAIGMINNANEILRNSDSRNRFKYRQPSASKVSKVCNPLC
jgi:hypothetical protein